MVIVTGLVIYSFCITEVTVQRFNEIGHQTMKIPEQVGRGSKKIKIAQKYLSRLWGYFSVK